MTENDPRLERLLQAVEDASTSGDLRLAEAKLQVYQEHRNQS